jgi:hypothetical protein
MGIGGKAKFMGEAEESNSVVTPFDFAQGFTPAFGRAGDVRCERFERPKAKALGYLEAKTTTKAKGKCKSDSAVFCSFEEEVAFAGVAGEGGGAFEFGAGFGVAV